MPSQPLSRKHQILVISQLAKSLLQTFDEFDWKQLTFEEKADIKPVLKNLAQQLRAIRKRLKSAPIQATDLKTRKPLPVTEEAALPGHPHPGEGRHGAAARPDRCASSI